MAQASAQSIVHGKFDAPQAGAAAASTFGRTLPPIGYVEFCGRGEAECDYAEGSSGRLTLNADSWGKLVAVNARVNRNIRPASSHELFNVPQYWTYPIDAGDCNAYTLLKKRYLQKLGIPADRLLLTVVLTEAHEGHLVLTIPTDRGDYILDNRRDEILRWDQTGYTFLKRQAQTRATEWVSLQKNAPQAIVTNKVE